MSKGIGLNQRRMLALLKEEEFPVYQRWIAEQLKIAKPNVSRAAKSLLQREYLLRSKRGALLLSDNLERYARAYYQWLQEEIASITAEGGFAAPYCIQALLSQKPILYRASGEQVDVPYWNYK